MTDLSVIIPSRNEMFLARTIQDILEHMHGDTEVIAVLDGCWAEPGIPQHERVTVLHFPESIGQRAATNRGAAISSGKYIMKCDAHCAFDDGWDVKMLEVIQPNWTMVSTMKNLHIFDWVCPNGHRRYQGPSGPCKECGEPTVMEVVWIAKKSPNSSSYCFDAEPHFQYFGDWSKRPAGKGDITPSMSLQGSCFMLSREKYFELDICGEEFGIWGSQGIEVACKTWLSGGEVMINHNTWYAHCFRTQGGDFGFPYPLSGKQVDHAKKLAKSLFFENRWEKQIRPLSWLVEKFWPVRGWEQADLDALKQFDGNVTGEKPVEPPAPLSRVDKPTRGIIYYSDCQLDPAIAEAVRARLGKVSTDLHIPVVSATLRKVKFGQKHIWFPHLKRSPLSMFKQIRAALEHSTAEVIYFAEHDVLYSPSHFDFIPPRKDRFYYNINFWKVRIDDGHALHFDACQTSGLVAYRELLLAEYGKIIEQVERDGFSVKAISYEPGTRDGRAETFRSAQPILDIRHDGNLTANRWSRDQFRDPRSCQNWQEAEYVPGWYEAGKFASLLSGEMLNV